MPLYKGAIFLYVRHLLYRTTPLPNRPRPTHIDASVAPLILLQHHTLLLYDVTAKVISL